MERLQYFIAGDALVVLLTNNAFDEVMSSNGPWT